MANQLRGMAMLTEGERLLLAGLRRNDNALCATIERSASSWDRLQDAAERLSLNVSAMQTLRGEIMRRLGLPYGSAIVLGEREAYYAMAE